MRTLVGGIGYRNLRDYSVGPMLTDRLAAREFPAGVVVEDVSYNPIALVQRLEDDPPGRRFERAILVSGVSRAGGRKPGSLTAYRWDGALPSPERVQAAVAEGITGVISLDNTLVILRYFGVLPRDTVILEVEPAHQEFGDEFSQEVAVTFEPACELVSSLALDPSLAARLPEAPLGGAPTGSHVWRKA